MNKYTSILAAGLACAACAGKVTGGEPSPSGNVSPTTSVDQTSAPGSPPASGAASAYAPLLPGEAPGSTHAMLRRSAAVVEGTVQEISYSYDEQRGPRTISKIAIDDVYLGDHPGGTVELAMFGGPTPDGRYISSSIGSEFVVGGRYVLFLTNSRWSVTPLEAPALRIAEASGREVLTNESNQTLTGLEPEGLLFGPAPTLLAAAGTLDRSELKRLLAEATADERVAPAGAFSKAPTMPSNNWRVSPGSRSTYTPTPGGATPTLIK